MSGLAIRRIVLLAAAVGLGVLAFVTRDVDDPPPAAYAVANEPVMPAVVEGDVLSTSWFCPGGPTDNGGRTVVTVLNTTDSTRTARVTAIPTGGEPASTDLELGPRARRQVDLGALATAPHTAATVEVFGGGVLAEQTVSLSVGAGASACANATSSVWYQPEGSTILGTSLQLVLFNPTSADVLIDVGFVTRDRLREPPELQGITIESQSVRLVDVGAVAQREATVSTVVQARRGRLVVGRVQVRDTRAEKGVAAGPAAANAAPNWWFPDGEKGEGVSERFVVFNPSDVDASVGLSVQPAGGVATGVAPGGQPVAEVGVVVPPGRFAVVDLGANADVPAGRHDVLVSIEGDDTPVVVEQVLTRVRDDRATTTSLLGARLASERWYVAEPSVTVNGVLVVMNAAGLDVGVSIDSLGPAGPVPVTGIDPITLAPGGAAEVIVPSSVGDLPLLVQGDGPIVVEWRARPGGDIPGLVAALGVPALAGEP